MCVRPLNTAIIAATFGKLDMVIMSVTLVAAKNAKYNKFTHHARKSPVKHKKWIEYVLCKSFLLFLWNMYCFATGLVTPSTCKYLAQVKPV